MFTLETFLQVISNVLHEPLETLVGDGARSSCVFFWPSFNNLLGVKTCLDNLMHAECLGHTFGTSQSQLKS